MMSGGCDAIRFAVWTPYWLALKLEGVACVSVWWRLPSGRSAHHLV